MSLDNGRVNGNMESVYENRAEAGRLAGWERAVLSKLCTVHLWSYYSERQARVFLNT